MGKAGVLINCRFQCVVLRAITLISITVEQVFFRNSGMDAAQAETAQGCAVEGGEERISCSAALLPMLGNKYWLIKKPA